MRSRHSTNRSGQKCNLRLEWLEDRQLLDASGLACDVIWTIEGDDSDNVIKVYVDGGQQMGLLAADVDGQVSYGPPASEPGCIKVNARRGHDVITIDNSVVLQTTELRGGHGDDTIVGSMQDDIISGGRGKDIIDGRGGNDEVWGDIMWIADKIAGVGSLKLDHGGVPEGDGVVQPADDFIVGGTGNDTIHGGAGNDHIYGDAGPLSATGGLAALAPQSETELGWGAERTDIDGRPMEGGQDRLFGDAGEDLLHGGPGEDFFHGGEGCNRVYAKDGYVDVILPGPCDIIIRDRYDLLAPFPPEDDSVVEAQPTDARDTILSEPEVGIVSPNVTVSDPVVASSMSTERDAKHNLKEIADEDDEPLEYFS